MNSFLKTYAEPGTDLQTSSDVAVIMPTIMRPEIEQALGSVFRQDLQARIQVLIGIDTPGADLTFLDAICAGRPENIVVQVFYPGYSTSARHGGLSAATDGGALRCILSYLANSQFVAYLDDDNWWRPDHLRLLRQWISQFDWAFSLRWFVHPVTRRPICIDEWESLGPGQGVFKDVFGGYVDPNCLMLNKTVCEVALPYWNRPIRGDPGGASADRNVFAVLRQYCTGICTGEPTAYYTLNPDDGVHASRVRLMGEAYQKAGAT